MAESHRTSGVRRDGGGLQAGVRRARAAGLLGAVAVLLGFTGFVTAGAAQASRPPMAAGGAWKVEPTPNPAGAAINELSAVSCTSGRACTAVGSRAASLSSPSSTLAERWNGTGWRIQRTIFLQAWNGRSWRLVTAPRPAGFAQGALNGTSCAPARCSAVGARSGGAVPVATLAMAN